MQRDELAKRLDLRKGGRALEQLAIGEARFVAKKPARREREDRVAVERVQGRARVAGAEGVLGGGQLEAGLGRDLGRRAGRDGLPTDPFAYAGDWCWSSARVTASIVPGGSWAPLGVPKMRERRMPMAVSRSFPPDRRSDAPARSRARAPALARSNGGAAARSAMAMSWSSSPTPLSIAAVVVPSLAASRESSIRMRTPSEVRIAVVCVSPARTRSTIGGRCASPAERACSRSARRSRSRDR